MTTTSIGAGGSMANGHRTPLTGRLLLAGAIAGPFYLSLGVAQGLVRDGFDFGRHPLSVLANGPGGWIQTANLAVTGMMVATAAVGIWRVLGPGSRAAVSFLAAYGVAMITAAVFPADPVDGFPPGTPEGFPTSISTTGTLHFVAGAIGFACLAFAGLATAWTMMRRRAVPLAMLSLVSGLVVLFGFFGGVALPMGVLGMWLAVVVGWVWLSVLTLRLRAT